MIDLMPNETLLPQILLFILVFISLNFLVFRPVLRLLARRKELTLGATKAAEVLNGKTEGLLKDYTRQLEEARHRGLELKQKRTQEGAAQAEEILGKTRSQLEGILENNRQEISRQSKEAQLILRKHSRDLSIEMAEKLLGRKVSA